MTGFLGWLGTYRLLPIVFAFGLGAFLATAQSFAGKSKDETASTNSQLGKTVFVDVSVFGRRNKEAKRMTKMHMEYAKKGGLWSTLPFTLKMVIWKVSSLRT